MVVDVEVVFEYADACVEVVEVVEVGDVAAFWMALCARKAERNEPKKGLWFDILYVLFGSCSLCGRCGVVLRAVEWISNHGY